MDVAAAAVAVEGEPLVFAVTVAPVSELPLEVHYATSDGTAAAGADYEATSGTLVIPPGKTDTTITVTTIDDDLDEVDQETVTLTLSAPKDAVLGASRSDRMHCGQ